eukprot:476623-Pyramimonas_sp.AAC.1
MRPEVGVGLLIVGIAREVNSLASLPSRHLCSDSFCDCRLVSECPRTANCVCPRTQARQPLRGSRPISSPGRASLPRGRG